MKLTMIHAVVISWIIVLLSVSDLYAQESNETFQFDGKAGLLIDKSGKIFLNDCPRASEGVEILIEQVLAF